MKENWVSIINSICIALTFLLFCFIAFISMKLMASNPNQAGLYWISFCIILVGFYVLLGIWDISDSLYKKRKVNK